MKKTFFMVGILAALSMTAFGAESDGTTTINLKGTAVAAINIVPQGGDTIDFGRVMATKTSDQSKILDITGTKGQKVKIKADLGSAGKFITIANGSGITADYGTAIDLASTGKATATLKLTYSPESDTDSLINETVIVTATYSD